MKHRFRGSRPPLSFWRHSGMLAHSSALDAFSESWPALEPGPLAQSVRRSSAIGEAQIGGPRQRECVEGVADKVEDGNDEEGDPPARATVNTWKSNSGPGGDEEADIGGEDDESNEHPEQPASPANRTEDDDPKSNQRDEGDGWCPHPASVRQHVSGDRPEGRRRRRAGRGVLGSDRTFVRFLRWSAPARVSGGFRTSPRILIGAASASMTDLGRVTIAFGEVGHRSEQNVSQAVAS